MDAVPSKLATLKDNRIAVFKGPADCCAQSRENECYCGDSSKTLIVAMSFYTISGLLRAISFEKIVWEISCFKRKVKPTDTVEKVSSRLSTAP